MGSGGSPRWRGERARCARARVSFTCDGWPRYGGRVAADPDRSSPPPGGWTPVVAVAAATTVGVAVRTRRRNVLTKSFRISAAAASHARHFASLRASTDASTATSTAATDGRPNAERHLHPRRSGDGRVWNRTTSARGLPPSLPTYWELNGDILINSYRTVYKYRTPPPGPSTRVPAVNIAARAHRITYYLFYY